MGENASLHEWNSIQNFIDIQVLWLKGTDILCYFSRTLLRNCQSSSIYEVMLKDYCPCLYIPYLKTLVEKLLFQYW